MAPKTRGASGSGVGMKRKQVARRPARQPSPESSDSSTPPASPVHSSAQVDPLAGRVIVMGRKMDFELFEAEGFLVGRQILEMGWEKICSLDCPTYPSLVKDFYKNLARGDNGLVSTVRNVRVTVTVNSLSRLLRLPTSGPASFNSEDRCPALSRLLNREIEEFEEVLANQLSLELRLLHNICSRILFPKSGRFDYISERDAFVMDAVTLGKPINLPNMMIWYMADCASKKRVCLPYGMILTQIFQTQGVVIMDSEPQRRLRHTDFYSLATIHRMGFVKKNGHWERKSQSEERATDTEAPGPSTRRSSPVHHRSMPAPAPASPIHSSIPVPAPTHTSSATTSVSFSDEQLAQLKGLLDAQKEEIKMEMSNEFKLALNSFEDRLSKMETILGSSCDSLKIDLKGIFEEIGNIGGDSKVYAKCNAELQDKIVTATAFLDRRLKEFVLTQSKGMERIVEDLQRLFKSN